MKEEGLTDKEMFKALLDGNKLEKVRQAGSGYFVYLNGEDLVNNLGEPSVLYKITPADRYKIKD